MLRTEQAVDNALAASFPASDPAPWTPGLARPGPPHEPARTRATVKARLLRDPFFQRSGTRTAAPRRNGSEVSPLHALASLAGAGGLVMLLPFVILAIGTPVALAVRALLELVLWVFPAMR